jgi:hypothetical protein
VSALGFSARMNDKPRMPFRVLGLDLIDVAGVCCLLVQSSPERPFLKGAEMPGPMDRSSLTGTTSLPDGIDLRPRSVPDPVRANPSYVSSAGATVMTCEELAEAGSAATPPAPKLDHFGERVSHMTGRFILSGSSDAYRIWGFQSAKPAIEFPMTREGWARAWTTFRELQSPTA